MAHDLDKPLTDTDAAYLASVVNDYDAGGWPVQFVLPADAAKMRARVLGVPDSRLLRLRWSCATEET